MTSTIKKWFNLDTESGDFSCQEQLRQCEFKMERDYEWLRDEAEITIRKKNVEILRLRKENKEYKKKLQKCMINNTI